MGTRQRRAEEALAVRICRTSKLAVVQTMRTVKGSGGVFSFL